MNSTSILVPVAALALWTLAVLALIPYQRFSAAAQGLVTDEDFKYGESARVPPHVSIPNRHIMNLLEIPLLFYVACLTLVVIQKVDPLFVNLAWAYFAFRVGHSFVHLTYNRVMHWVFFYAISNLIVTIIWIRIMLALGT